MNMTNGLLEEREVLEKLAMKRVCPCLYYELADCMSETSDDELIAIIDGTLVCTECDANQSERG